MRLGRRRSSSGLRVSLVARCGAGLLLLAVAMGAASCARPVPTSWQPPSLRDVRAALEGLSLRDFVDTAYRLYLLRTPQTVTERGLADALGVRDDRLDDLSETSLRETEAMARAIAARLSQYERDGLSREDQITVDAAERFWSAVVESVDAPFREYAVSGGVDSALNRLSSRFLETWRLASAEDVQDYLACLRQARGQIDQIAARLRRDAARGMIPPVEVLGEVLALLASLRITETFSPSPYLPDRIVAGHHPFQVAFRERLLEMVDAVDRTSRVEILAESFDILAGQVIPAYERLAYLVTEVASRAPSTSLSLRQFSGGAEAYARRLRVAAAVDIDPQAAHEIGREAVARLRIEIERAVLAAGSAMGGSPDASAETATALQFLGTLRDATARAVGQMPKTEVDVIISSWGLRYVLSQAGSDEPARLFAPAVEGGLSGSLADEMVRKTYPGEHVLLSRWREGDLVSLRAWEAPPGWLLGWEAYAARLAAELGIYDGDPEAELRRLRSELALALALVVDTGVHWLDWNLDDVEAYCAPDLSAREAVALALESANDPARPSAPMLGLLEILALRSSDAKARGAGFRLASFHDRLLALGSVSFGTANDALLSVP